MRRDPVARQPIKAVKTVCAINRYAKPKCRTEYLPCLRAGKMFDPLTIRYPHGSVEAQAPRAEIPALLQANARPMSPRRPRQWLPIYWRIVRSVRHRRSPKTTSCHLNRENSRSAYPHGLLSSSIATVSLTTTTCRRKSFHAITGRAMNSNVRTGLRVLIAAITYCRGLLAPVCRLAVWPSSFSRPLVVNPTSNHPASYLRSGGARSRPMAAWPAGDLWVGSMLPSASQPSGGYQAAAREARADCAGFDRDATAFPPPKFRHTYRDGLADANQGNLLASDECCSRRARNARESEPERPSLDKAGFSQLGRRRSAGLSVPTFFFSVSASLFFIT